MNVPPRALALAAALIAASPAFAMTETQAAANVMYFAFATQEGEVCEKLGYPGRAAFRVWEQENAGVFVASMRRVEDHAAETLKISRDEARQTSAALFERLKGRYDREFAPDVSARSCGRFGERLRLYGSKLVRN